MESFFLFNPLDGLHTSVFGSTFFGGFPCSLSLLTGSSRPRRVLGRENEEFDSLFTAPFSLDSDDEDRLWLCAVIGPGFCRKSSSLSDGDVAGLATLALRGVPWNKSW